MSPVPKLDRPRKRVETLMVDTCLITHDTSGSLDVTWNPDTLAPNVPGPDATLYNGKCLVKMAHANYRFVPPETLQGRIYTHEALLPWDAPAPTIGDTFTLTATADPALLNVPMQVVGVIDTSSFPVVRKLALLHAAAAQLVDEG